MVIPEHIAIVMDGNRRWAKEKGLTSYQGHKKGIDNIEPIISYCDQIGVKTLTLYCFSTENWQRSQNETKYLMNLFTRYIETNIKKLADNNIKIKHTGRKDRIPKRLAILLQNAESISKDNTGLAVNLAIDYGARDEIIRAIKKIKGDITESSISNNLDIPHNIDLFIRTSGEHRISNFLVWQISYSELWFEDIYFPDFSIDILQKIIENYGGRRRRFGR